MKKAEKSASVVIGILLFTIAAIFSVGLLMQLLDFGVVTPGQQSGLYRFGQMLVSTYGISSVFIPVFLITAGFFCFVEKWSTQKAVCLLVSVIPFFTAVVGERICRNIAAEDEGPIAAVKIVSLVVIALLMIVAEYLVTLVIVGTFKKNDAKKAEAFSFDEPDEKPLVKTVSNDKQKDEDAELNAVIDKSISEATAGDWKLQDLLNTSKNKATPESIQEKKADTDSKYGKFDSGNYVKEASTVESHEAIESVEPEYQEEDAEKLELPNVSDILNLDTPDESEQNEETDSVEQDSETEMEEELSEIDEAESSVEQPEMEQTEIDMNADPWNVVKPESSEGAQVVYLGKVVKPSRKHPEDEHELEDPAGLVEETSSEQDDVLANDETPPVDSTPPNFEKGYGIEEEPENPKDNSGHSMLSLLDNVFSKMDSDVRAEVEAKNDVASDGVFNPIAPTVVDSTGALRSEQIDGNLTTQNTMAVSTDAATLEKNNEGLLAPIPRAVPKRVKHGPYRIPTELLTAYADNPYWIIDAATNMAAQNLKETLNEFKIEAEVTGIRKGPVVTMFEILPAPGVKLSKIVALQDNLALRLAASSIRIVAPIPGKRAVGIEVPNKNRAIVSFRECIEQNLPEWKKMAVPVVLGKDIQGETQIIDLVKTPHLLIAGSTGSGKSVCVNSMILSILFKRNPNEVKLILIDPKIVELKLYNDIPHLLTPVITEPKRAMQALQYCLCEMERRYALLDGLGVRDIANYNKRIQERKICTEKLPYIVVIIDEFADLMATTGKELEGIVARLAAMSRAVVIHLVLATQRPSIDVITGLIKANIPSRVAFMVASKTDSRIIIDQVGAEKLLGKGDMLYSSSTDPFPVRIQGTFVSDNEVEDVVDAVKQWGEPEYIDDEIFIDDDEEGDGGEQLSLFSGSGEDPLYEKALDIVVQAGKASASYIQRRLKIGYNRAARLVEEMEDRGIVGPANGSKPREIIHMP